MLKSGTQLTRLPKVSGKACAQYVSSVWESCVQKIAVLHTPHFATSELWINEQYSPTLYTNCIQLLDSLVGKFTSVNFGFYTVYTGSTTTTTTFIYKKRGTL